MHRLSHKITKSLLLCFGLYLLSISSNLFASDDWPTIGMNSALIITPAANQQTNFQQGLKVVLIKVSGNPSIMSLPMIRSASSHAAQMVQSYHVVQQTNSTPNTSVRTALVIQYNSQAIAHLLKVAGQPMWDARRPTTLVWLAIKQTNGTFEPIDTTQMNHQPIATTLTQVAQNRGLTLLFPEMDLNDQALTQSNDANGLLSSDALQKLADRYHVQSVLAGTLAQTNNQWQAQWRYSLDSAPLTWQQPLSSAQTITENALNIVASTMVAQLALSSNTGQQTHLYIHVSGITDLTTYAHLGQCLKHLRHMTQLTPVDLSEQSVTLLATYDDSINKLQQALTHTCHLAFDNTMPAPTKTAPSQLRQRPNLQTMLLHFGGPPS